MPKGVYNHRGVPPEQRFWRHVKKTSDCWIWVGALRTDGYGMFRASKERVIIAAHRFSYELHNGKIPQGEGYHGNCVLHSCDNKKCVNPSHLRVGTQSENIKEMWDKDRHKIPA